jgi:LPXTG-site transpeptidase (sortase) family protein
MLPFPLTLGGREHSVIPDDTPAGIAGIEDDRIATPAQAQDTPPSGDTSEPGTPSPASLPETQTADTSFWIDIPKIGLHHSIIPGVDPVDENEYMKILEENIAHGKYTALPPAASGNTYLFAHSMRASGNVTPDGGWFTRIDELSPGDIIYVNYHGELYLYTVTDTEIISPLQTSVYTGNSIYGEHRSLTLQTCYPRGGTELRFMVYAIGEK